MTFSVKNCPFRHFHTHTHEKPFGCNVCNMSFSENNNLHKQIRTHANRINSLVIFAISHCSEDLHALAFSYF